MLRHHRSLLSPLTSLPSRRTLSAFVSAMAATATPPSPAGLLPTNACLAVAPNGTVSLDPSQTAPILEAPPAAAARLRTLVLNRPSTLNALDHSMTRTLAARIAALDAAPTVDCILLTSSSPRAFCAGGDIRSLLASADAGDAAAIAEYFRGEYRLDNLVATIGTHVVSITDGITMGGGVGLSVHGGFRIATERTTWAMPECNIGLFPDCAVAHVLSRIPDGKGLYLSITGARLTGGDAGLVDMGLATHLVPSASVPALVERLGSVDLTSRLSISRAIVDFAPAEALPAMPYCDVIDECFGKVGSVEEVVARLEKVVERGGGEGEFAGAALERMRAASPFSVKVSFEAIRRAKTMSLPEVFDMDFRLAVRMASRPDFSAGVKSAVVTKDRNPVWNPTELGTVNDADVQAMFEPFSEESGIAELGTMLKARKTGKNAKL